MKISLLSNQNKKKQRLFLTISNIWLRINARSNDPLGSIHTRHFQMDKTNQEYAFALYAKLAVHAGRDHASKILHWY